MKCIKGIDSSRVLEFHRLTREALEHIVDYQEKENVKIKKRVDELEVTLNLGHNLQNHFLSWFLMFFLKNQYWIKHLGFSMSFKILLWVTYKGGWT